MNFNFLHLARMLADRRVTATPLRVLRELRRRGKTRVPSNVQAEVERSSRPGRRTWRFVRRWLDGERLTRHRGQWVVNSFLPPFPGPAYDRLFENLLSGRRLSPVSAFLAVTSECPCHCWHCSLHGRPGGSLDTRQWLRTIGQLHALGASVIGFTGGEPLCRDDLPELVRAAQDGGAATILFTCGMGMDARWIDRLREAGLWALCVSLDDVDEEAFDRLRGKPGAFLSAVQALRLSRSAGFYTMIGMVATRRVVREGLHRRIHALGRRLGVHELRLVEPMPCGRLAGAADDALLQPGDVAELRAFHRRTNRRGRSPKVCAFNQVESPEIFGCGAGTQHLFIDPGGVVCPCDFTPLGFGNADGEPLADTWRRMNRAMGGAPRRHCFIQRHRAAIDRHAAAGFPLPPEISERVCAEAGHDGLPDYFQVVTAGGSPKEGE